jgi:parvulin-like peptidyl-prolyl isomerase
MKNALLILFLAAGTLFAQTNEEPIITATGGTNEGPVITAIDGYAARVGNTIITYGEIRESIAPYMQQLFQRYQGEELARHIQETMLAARESLIEEALIQEEAKSLGLALPPPAIQEEANRLIRERFDNNRTHFNRALADRRMTYEEWLDDVSDQITLRLYYNREVIRRASVSKESIREAYEQHKEEFFIPFKVKFSAILINKGTSEEDRAVKKQQVNDILQKLTAGADFAETAKEVSEGIRADDGGAFPWSEPKDIREELRPALHSVATGEISDLIETDEEFYIIKIEERREEGYVPFDDVREQIESQLLALDQKRLHEELMARLTERHFVIRY